MDVCHKQGHLLHYHLQPQQLKDNRIHIPSHSYTDYIHTFRIPFPCMESHTFHTCCCNQSPSHNSSSGSPCRIPSHIHNPCPFHTSSMDYIRNPFHTYLNKDYIRSRKDFRNHSYCTHYFRNCKYCCTGFDLDCLGSLV